MSEITSVVAKTDDGTVQITFNIPAEIIENTRSQVIRESVANVTVPGFRKGKAPIGKAKERLDQRVVMEKTLNKILPKAFSDVVIKNNLKPAIFPKFEILNQEDNKDWQIMCTTCELPKIDLGDYKALVKNSLAEPIRAPGQPKKKEIEREEKEQRVLKALMEGIKVTIPKIIIEEEVNSRLSSLLARLEKLGLSLESYLASLNKKVDDLKKEYYDQSIQTINMELILMAIADAENTKVDEKNIDKAIIASGVENSEDQRRIVAQILKKRAVLDSLLQLG